LSKIKILPENIANQIAAGEVVERPASVVKEFVENGIDAGATRITVEVEGGGTRLIRVIDNGEGMDADDVLLCLERHGTSKIRESEDLLAISTLGFRGEAVPSIGSVSKLVIISRRADQPLGCQAEVHYGTVRKVHEMGCSQGTIMEVRQLFGNVPARRKFLKTARTELSHIEEVILAAALAHPEIGLRYFVDGRPVQDFPEDSTLRERIALIYKMGQEPLVVIDTPGAVTVSGFLAAPDAVSGVAARLRIFVNGRMIRDRMINHAVGEGGHGFYLKGRRPSGVLMIQVDPRTVDVNVHPTKQEVRFHRSQSVHEAVASCIRQALVDYQQAVKDVVFGQTEPRTLKVKETEKTEAVSLVPHVEPQMLPVSKPTVQHKKDHVPAAEPAAAETEYSIPVPVSESLKDEEKADHPLGLLTYLGQFQSSYLLCESEQGLVVIDQHAAHERLLFEKLKKQVMGSVVTQKLLFPEMLTFTRQQIRVFEQYGDEICDLGLEIEHFGGDSYVIKTVPALLGHIGPVEIVTGIFDRYLHFDVKGSRATRFEDVLAVMACRAAVKANHVLLPEEGVALLKQMFDADVFSHCPHGRPVYRLFSAGDVKKWFLRT
jgi:DNA mismatch repair protein MutL